MKKEILKALKESRRQDLMERQVDIAGGEKVWAVTLNNAEWNRTNPVMDVSGFNQSDAEANVEKKYNTSSSIFSDGYTVSPSPELAFILNLFKRYKVNFIDMSGSFERVVTVTVEADYNSPFGNTDIYVVFYQKPQGGVYRFKSSLKVVDPNKPFDYSLNGQPSKNTTYTKLKESELNRRETMKQFNGEKAGRRNMINERVLKEDYGWEIKRGKEWDALEEMIEIMGEKRALDSIARWMGTDDLGKAIAFIYRNNDISDSQYLEEKIKD